jgi:hypothetical protein
MGERRRERRKTASDFKNRPPSSPANLLILVVIGVLAASALTAALFGTGFEETTPHGQVLTALQRVGDAQEERHLRAGAFAGWMDKLDVEPPADVRVDIVRGDANGWEAIATHAIGLGCAQVGKVERGRPVREPPVCYTLPAD